MTRNNIELVNALISDFDKYFSKRSTLFLTIDGFLSKSLEWHFFAWKQYWTLYKNEKKRREWMSWVTIYYSLTEIIKKIGKRTQEDSIYEYHFIHAFVEPFRNHVNLTKNEHISADENELYYKRDLFRMFYAVLFYVFDNLDSFHRMLNSDYFWDNFPREWKITRETWELGGLSYDVYLNWALSRVGSRQEYDNVLQEVTRKLFPTVDFKTWSRILIFVLSPYSFEGRVKSIIERTWVFGFVNPATPIQGDKVENAFRFARSLFGSTFTEEKLTEYIAEAEGLDYAEKPHEERRKQEFLTIFRGMLDYLQNHAEEQ